ncbi:MAG: hypothetical protein CVU17_08365 [Betaproteobacteria bacterium HGW-Betaproteobacteria-11]|nr:MAG: hypothetical protein CVU17_08365 [Betaproteobacteria bacterium HGW-Betaproteobacteria-11]
MTIVELAAYTLFNNTRHASACKRTPAGFLLPMKFTKPAIPLDDQIALLRSRGLTIADEGRARHYLRFVGYYRLAGYALPYQVNYNADGSHRFLDGVSFEDILDLYVFDRKLRLAVMDAVERIEVAFRAQFSQGMSELHGPHWFMDAAHFVPSYPTESSSTASRTTLATTRRGRRCVRPSSSTTTTSMVTRNYRRRGWCSKCCPSERCRAGFMAARAVLPAQSGRPPSAPMESHLHHQADPGQAIRRRFAGHHALLCPGRDGRGAAEGGFARYPLGPTACRSARRASQGAGRSPWLPGRLA